MSAITKDQILDAVAAMSVLDLSEMIKAMEEDKDPAKLITLEEAMAPNHTNP